MVYRRVKAVDTLRVSLPNQTTTTLVATISSDGKARVYDMAEVPKPVAKSNVKTIVPVGEYDSNGSRLVCLALVDSDNVEDKGSMVGKRKRNEDDQEDDEDEEGDEPEALGQEPGTRDEELVSEDRSDDE